VLKIDHAGAFHYNLPAMHSHRIGPIALLTDFGNSDTYVGAMKAMILSRAPSAPIFDLTHSIAAGDIRHAAFEAWRIRPYLPAGTILVGVVDPGVGSERKPIAINFPDFCCVGPDNGIFSYLLETEPGHTAVELSRAEFWGEPVSQTFHGRDIFAPVAAQLATGTSFDRVGVPISSLCRLPLPRLDFDTPQTITGEILHIDHFGNLVSSIGRLSVTGPNLHCSSWQAPQESFEFLRDRVRIQLGDSQPLSLMNSFRAVPTGQSLAYIGSAGLLEIAVNGGNAAETFLARRGDPITLTY
jgi:S-adenosylmethionine hydrolase